MPQRRVELVPLVGHLSQAHVRRARGGRRRPAGYCGHFQCLPAGPGGRVQVALGALNLAEEIENPCRQCGQARCPPLGDAGHEGALSLGQLTTKPLTDGQVPPGDDVQQPLALVGLSHRL